MKKPESGEAGSEDARRVWHVMSDLVLDNERRREVSAAVGLPFARVRALRRLIPGPMTLAQLASQLNIDPPNCTPVVDDLEARGLVERQPNPADRRSRFVVTTAEGRRLAVVAEDILERPPAALADLSPSRLRQLAEILADVARPGD